MQLPSISILLPNKRPDKKGLLPVMIRVIYKRKIFHKSTGFKIAPNLFSAEKLIHTSVVNAAYKNRKIRDQVAGYERQFIKLAEDENLSIEAIKGILAGKEGSVDLVNGVLQKVIARLDYSVSGSYLKSLNSTKSKLKEYNPNISISGLSSEFMNDFELYMRKKLKNEHNTVSVTLRRLATMINKAFELKIISFNPLANYTPPTYRQTKRNYLTEEEIEKVYQFSQETQNQYLKTIAKWFLLACYSGLRYGDLQRWDESKMIIGKRLYFSDQKTDNPHYIPLYPKLEEAIQAVREIRKIPENQVCNRGLKEIAGICGIEKNVSMHLARHSFAIMWLDKGGSLEVLQALLGHTKLSTTLIYGKISSKRIDNEVEKAFGG